MSTWFTVWTSGPCMLPSPIVMRHTLKKCIPETRADARNQNCADSCGLIGSLCLPETCTE